MPCEYRFIASVTRQTLPVRSPLPNRQPSMRSAPAMTRELRRGDAGTAIVMRMQAQQHAVAPRQIAVHPLDLIGVDVRRGDLDRRRQVEDDRLGRRRLPDVHHRFADLLGEVELGHREGFRRIFVAPVDVRLFGGALTAKLGAVDGDLDDPGLVLAVDDAPEQRRRRVVQVHDHAPGAAHRFEGPPDKLVARLGRAPGSSRHRESARPRSSGARSRNRSATPKEIRPRFP